ncbi:MAG: DNA repair protein RecO [Dongiaceae bacterium]
MEWTEEGIVLTARRHGEGGAIVSVMTRGQGRCAGLVKGGSSRRQAGRYEPGNRVVATWRARLSEHLGNFTCEVIANPSAGLYDRPLRLAALAAATAVAEAVLPEREPHPAVHDGLERLLAALQADPDPLWQARYVRWELALLAELGFGLDLTRCAISGARDGLAFVSPRTGRAVTAEAGAPWQGQLFALPAFLTDPAMPAESSQAARAGLALTGHFLERHVFLHRTSGEPAARRRLIQRLGNGGG